MCQLFAFYSRCLLRQSSAHYIADVGSSPMRNSPKNRQRQHVFSSSIIYRADKRRLRLIVSSLNFLLRSRIYNERFTFEYHQLEVYSNYLTLPSIDGFKFSDIEWHYVHTQIERCTKPAIPSFRCICDQIARINWCERWPIGRTLSILPFPPPPLPTPRPLPRPLPPRPLLLLHLLFLHLFPGQLFRLCHILAINNCESPGAVSLFYNATPSNVFSGS